MVSGMVAWTVAFASTFFLPLLPLRMVTVSVT